MLNYEIDPAVLASRAPRGTEIDITEHYWGYVTQRDGSTVEYQVEHPQWRVWRGGEPSFDCDVVGLYGAEFVSALRGTPSSSFLVEGSDVVVRKGVKIGDTVVVTIHPSRVSGEYRGLMVRLLRPSDGFNWGQSAEQTVD